MTSFQNEQEIGQLEKRKGGYFFLKMDADIINQFKNKRHTRFICTLEERVTFQCGLNHLGDGNFFIILSIKNLMAVGKKMGDKIHFELNEDPNPLGVDMPEVLDVILEQYKELNDIFKSLTPGKKRSIIHSINKTKDIDRQIEKAIEIITNVAKPGTHK